MIQQFESVFREDLERYQKLKQDDFRRLMASFVKLELAYAQQVKKFWENMVPGIGKLQAVVEG